MIQAITSREYKLILNSDRFQDREKGCQEFWRLVEFLIKGEGGVVALVLLGRKQESLPNQGYGEFVSHPK